MIPIKQKVISGKNGDCFRACLASLLEDDSIPNLADNEVDSQFLRYNRYLAKRNLQVGFFRFGSAPPPQGNFIMLVRSSVYPGHSHAVIACQDYDTGRIKVIWNPNPQDPRGVEIPNDDMQSFYLLALVDPAKRAV